MLAISFYQAESVFPSMSATNSQIDNDGQLSHLMVEDGLAVKHEQKKDRKYIFCFVAIIALLSCLLFIWVIYPDGKPPRKITNCRSLPTGIYNIQINDNLPFAIRCDNDTAGGDWIAILNRFDGSENFTRNWNEFRKGFGNLTGEFFIGLDNLHRLTNSQQFELYVEYKYFDGIKGRARYDNFKIGNEKSGYTLDSLGHYNGTGQDDLMTIDNLKQKFTTYDQDNDKDSKNCAQAFSGAWWFKSCSGPNPFAKYSQYERVSELDTMSWNGFTPIQSIKMLIRGKQ